MPSKDLGDEVVSCVMELLISTEPDSAWHGACLALAELVRRGLLVPDRMPGNLHHANALILLHVHPTVAEEHTGD
eukprot:scaffold27345_cov20-Prasinocladus_malaysianus.AAC.1